MFCFDPAGSTNKWIPPAPAVDSPPAQAVKPAAETDPKRQGAMQLLSQGLQALKTGNRKLAKKFFLEAKESDPNNSLIEKYIKACDE